MKRFRLYGSMKTRKTIPIAILIILASSLLVQAEDTKKIRYKGKEWLEVNPAELYHQMDKYVYENVHFEIDYVYPEDHYVAPAKGYLSFYVRKEKGHGYIWVKKSKQDILESLYDFDSSEEKMGVFARVTRDMYLHEYVYFVIVKHIKLEDKH